MLFCLLWEAWRPCLCASSLRFIARFSCLFFHLPSPSTSVSPASFPLGSQKHLPQQWAWGLTIGATWPLWVEHPWPWLGLFTPGAAGWLPPGLFLEVWVTEFSSIQYTSMEALCTEQWGTHTGMSQSQRQACAKEKKDLEVYMLPVACRVGQGDSVKLRAGIKNWEWGPVMHGWGREEKNTLLGVLESLTIPINLIQLNQHNPI